MRLLYCSTDTQNGPSRAHALGCGYLGYVPTGIASAMPCVIVAGGDPFAVVVISDSPPTTLSAVNAVTGPMLTQEASDAAAAAQSGANQQTILAALTSAMQTDATYLALTTPSTAQTTAQVQALTRQMRALLRLAIGDFTGTT